MDNLLCSFIVCQDITLRDGGFSWTKIEKQLNLKSKSSAEHAYKRYLKSNRFQATKRAEEPQILSKTSEKKLANDVLNNPKTSLGRIRVTHNDLSCWDTTS